MGKYTSSKNYEYAFPVCYRQWKDDRGGDLGKSHGDPYAQHETPGCSSLHGYALSIKLEFTREVFHQIDDTDQLDARNWIVDYGSLRPLKSQLKQWFDHTMLVSNSDPHKEIFINLHKLGLAKVVEVEATGCEALAKFIHDYTNEIFLPDHYPANDESVTRCSKVTVSETPSNSAWYEG